MYCFRSDALTLQELCSRRAPVAILKLPGSDCRQWHYTCARSALEMCLEAAGSAVLFAHLILFLCYLGRAFRQLRARNYKCVPFFWTRRVCAQLGADTQPRCAGTSARPILLRG